MTLLKYCGNRTYEDYMMVQETQATHIGFIFVPSSNRFVEPQTVKQWMKKTPARPNQKTVGVVVNPDIDFLSNLCRTLPLDVLQFHGNESPDFIKEVKTLYSGEIWKVIHHRVGAEATMKLYEGFVDGFLVDCKVGEAWGGTGQSFDWTFIPSYLQEAHRQGVPCLIAGGVTAENVEDLLKWRPDGIDLASGIEQDEKKSLYQIQALERKVVPKMTKSYPDERGRFGEFGGQFVPETVMLAVQELEVSLNEAMQDEQFLETYRHTLKEYSGRPTPLTFAPRLTEYIGGAEIYLKREDLNHTGAHKINNAIGQGLLAKRMGKQKIVAETGAGQHGVASATIAAYLGLECKVFMGAKDIERQKLNVFRMELLGAEVVPVTSGSHTLKDATNEALRYWAEHVEDTFYLIGSVVGPHPYPMMVRDFQRVIGDETRAQFLELKGKLPEAIVACVGGGSNAIGIFYPFLKDDVALYGAEAAGLGIDTPEHAATLTKGRKGVIHGSLTYLIQDEHGQIIEPYSISAGLDYPGIGPEHAYLAETGRAVYEPITDEETMEALKLLSRLEGIIPALESAHALALAFKRAKTMKKDQAIVVNLSGRGDKDVEQIKHRLEAEGEA